MNPRFDLILNIFSLLLVSYFFLLNGIYLVQGLVSMHLLRHYIRRLKSRNESELQMLGGFPAVSILIPAYNESLTCVDTIESLQILDYRDYEILLINDGSTDETLAVLKEKFALEPALHPNPARLKTQPIREVFRSRNYPRLWVIDKENGGKADALNAGINYCQSPFFCAVDADTLLEPEALTRIVYPFMSCRYTVAVGGIIRILNGSCIQDHRITQIGLPDNVWARLQILEYLRAFLAARMSWNVLGGNLIISGAFGLFRHSSVLAVGGYASDTVGEDMELVVRLHRYYREQKQRYKITFVPDPAAWTQCPETLHDLYAQRERWQRGLVQSLWRHRVMLSNHRYGVVGQLAYPYYFFLEMLGPLLEVSGYVFFIVLLLLGKIAWVYGVTFIAVACGLGLLVSLLSLMLGEMNPRRLKHSRDVWRLLGTALLENFFYRQLLSVWRAWGVWTALRGHNQWGQIRRQSLISEKRHQT